MNDRSSADRRPVSTGISDPHNLRGGGITANSACLPKGTSGGGKAAIPLQFLLEGARVGKRAPCSTLSETAAELTEVARSHTRKLNGIDAFELVDEEDKTTTAARCGLTGIERDKAAAYYLFDDGTAYLFDEGAAPMLARTRSMGMDLQSQIDNESAAGIPDRSGGPVPGRIREPGAADGGTRRRALHRDRQPERLPLGDGGKHLLLQLHEMPSYRETVPLMAVEPPAADA